MAEGQSGLVRLNPDGSIGITVGGVRHTLTAVTLGQLRELRELFNQASAEVQDYYDLDHAPRIRELRDAVKAGTTHEERSKLRADIATERSAADLFTHAQWSAWWRRCFDLLSAKPLPAPDPDDPAVGLEPWMVDGKAAAAIGRMFSHWQTVPLGDAGDDPTRVLTQLLDQAG